MIRRVSIVGVGALGSHLALLLRNEDVALHFIDGDVVEAKNTASQVYGIQQVRRKKALALRELMGLMWGCKAEATPHWLTEHNVRQLLEKSDLVIDCLDNGPGRRVIQEYVRPARIPCLHGALAADGQFAKIIWDRDFVADDAAEGAATCDGGEFLPFISLTASYLAAAVQRFLLDDTRVGFMLTPRNLEVL